MTAKYFLATLLLAAGCGGSNDTCTANTACTPGSSLDYKFCNSGAANCYYKTGDGRQYHCITCDNCADARVAVESWCAAAPVRDLGTNNGNVGTNCGAMVSCGSSSGTYQACASLTGTDCGFKDSDGNSYACNSCADCAAASTQVTNWCQGGVVSLPDMAHTVIPNNCDLVQQDCGAGKKCIPNVDTNGNFTGGCVTDGTVAENGSCTPGMDPMVLNDNCKAGLYCDDLLGDAPPACRKLCAVDNDCDISGQRCLDTISAEIGGTAPAGVCVKPCTPFVSGISNCPSGSDCGGSYYDVDTTGATANSQPGFFYCKPTGAGAVNAACNTDKDCAAFLYCGYFDQTAQTGVCTPNCDTTAAHSTCPSPSPSGTPFCSSFSDTTNGAGFCSAM